MTTHTTRLAPSPTGALHLGNARTFLINWALARQNGWRVLLRIEDLDTPRVKPETIEQTRDTLTWLGLDWDDEMPLQSTEPEPARAAMQQLAQAGRVYPCERSRSDIARAAAAPHAEEEARETRFPSEFRPGVAPRPFDRPETNWRLICRPGVVAFDDVMAGPRRVDPYAEVGDFLVWTQRGTPAYQLAVVVDDARQGVTHVVRGNDLIPSTGRQLMLYATLGLEPVPTYIHLPLIRGGDSRRLAKRHGDTRVASYRHAGTTPERMIALLARWSGLGDAEAMSAADFARAFRLDTMPADDVTFTAEDDRWLLD